MLIRLTLSTTKQHIYLRADQIMTVERVFQNPLEVLVTYAGTAGPRGIAVYQVLESQDDIADGILQAIRSGEIVRLEEIAGTGSSPSRLVGPN